MYCACIALETPSGNNNNKNNNNDNNNDKTSPFCSAVHSQTFPERWQLPRMPFLFDSSGFYSRR